MVFACLASNGPFLKPLSLAQVNPPQYTPLVEIVPAPWTDPALVRRTTALMTGLGQAPIVLHREVNGFVLNRLQYALLMEAWRLVEVNPALYPACTCLHLFDAGFSSPCF